MITLKKIKGMTAAVLCFAGMLTSAGAVEMKANLMLRGDLFRAEREKKTGDVNYYYLENNQAKQIDNPGDGITFDFDGGIFGAHLALWYTTASGSSENMWAAYFRRTYGWIKPIDPLTIRLGYIGNDKFFKEKIDEWKVGSPFAILERDWDAHPKYINCNDVEGWGFGVEYRPFDQLIFNAGITPGKKGYIEDSSAAIYNEEGDSKTYIAPWGAGVKYYWRDFEFQASYRDGGMDSDRNHTWSVARFGAGIKNQHTYSFIQPILGFDYNKENKKTELNGMCFDLYGEYYWDALTVMLHAPVTFRWSGEEDDVSYMEMNLRVKYNTGSHGNLDDVAPYVMIGTNQNDVDYTAYSCAWLLSKDFADSFNMSFTAGAEFKVGKAEVDVGLRYEMFSNNHKAAYKKDYVFSIPFTLKFRAF